MINQAQQKIQLFSLILSLLLVLVLLLPRTGHAGGDETQKQTAWWYDRHSDPEVSYKRLDDWANKPRARKIDYQRSDLQATSKGQNERARPAACPGPRPCVGSSVKLAPGQNVPMLSGGQLGTVMVDDGSDYPFNVTNAVGQSGWFSAAQLVLVSPELDSSVDGVLAAIDERKGAKYNEL